MPTLLGPPLGSDTEHGSDRPMPTSRIPGNAVAGPGRYLWALVRTCLGWTFLWPFLDKTFGLGHETPSASAWVRGGLPTTGFLKASVGPFSGIYHDLSGSRSARATRWAWVAGGPTPATFATTRS